MSAGRAKEMTSLGEHGVDLRESQLFECANRRFGQSANTDQCHQVRTNKGVRGFTNRSFQCREAGTFPCGQLPGETITRPRRHDHRREQDLRLSVVLPGVQRADQDPLEHILPGLESRTCSGCERKQQPADETRPGRASLEFVEEQTRLDVGR